MKQMIKQHGVYWYLTGLSPLIDYCCPECKNTLIPIDNIIIVNNFNNDLRASEFGTLKFIINFKCNICNCQYYIERLQSEVIQANGE